MPQGNRMSSCPLPQGSVAVHRRSSTTHCPEAMRHFPVEVPLPTAPRQRGSLQKEFHCTLPQGNRRSSSPLPQGSVAVYRPQEFHYPLPRGSAAFSHKSSTAHCPKAAARVLAHCPKAVWRCTAGVPLPIAPRQCSIFPQKFHCPLPQSSEVMTRRSSTAHCPKAVGQCTEGIALPTAPR